MPRNSTRGLHHTDLRHTRSSKNQEEHCSGPVSLPPLGRRFTLTRERSRARGRDGLHACYRNPVIESVTGPTYAIVTTRTRRRNGDEVWVSEGLEGVTSPRRCSAGSGGTSLTIARDERRTETRERKRERMRRPAVDRFNAGSRRHW